MSEGVYAIEAAIAAKDRDARQIAERVKDGIAAHYETAAARYRNLAYVERKGGAEQKAINASTDEKGCEVIAETIRTLDLSPLLGEASGGKDGETK